MAMQPPPQVAGPQSLLAEAMAGRQVSQGAPMQVGAGGSQMGAREQLAYLAGNALRPTQLDPRENRLAEFDPAVDIRANTANNRLDLRQQQTDQANALLQQGLERYRAEGPGGRVAGQAITAEQAEQERLSRMALLQAQLGSSERQQGKELEYKREELDQKATLHANDLANRLTGLGMSTKSSETIANANNVMRQAINKDQLTFSYKKASDELDMLKNQLKARSDDLKLELKNRKEISEAQIEGRKGISDDQLALQEQEGQFNREATWEIENMRKTGSLERLQEELTFRRKELDQRKELEEARLSQDQANKTAFGATVGKVNKEYDQWISVDKAKFQRAEEENWYRGNLLGNAPVFNRTDANGQEVVIPPMTARGDMNLEWLNRARAWVHSGDKDAAGLATKFYQEVDMRVQRRDEQMRRLHHDYNKQAASLGIAPQTPTALSPTGRTPNVNQNAQGTIY